MTTPTPAIHAKLAATTPAPLTGGTTPKQGPLTGGTTPKGLTSMGVSIPVDRDGQVPAGARLEAMTVQLDRFYVEFERKVEARREEEERRLRALQDEIRAVDSANKSEARKRAEADRNLQATFEGQLINLHAKMEQQFIDLVEPLKKAVVDVNARLDLLEKTMAERYEAIFTKLEAAIQSFNKRMEVCESSVEREKKGRQEAEAMILKRIEEAVFKLEQANDVERTTRENQVAKVRDEIALDRAQRDKGTEKFNAYVREEFAKLKKEIESEAAAREREDDQIISAFKSFSLRHQEGMNVVA
eukprot:tig00020780_g13784.t1